jgi:hypothetical protein
MGAAVEQPSPRRGHRAGADRADDLAVGQGLAQQTKHSLVLELDPGVAADQ